MRKNHATGERKYTGPLEIELKEQSLETAEKYIESELNDMRISEILITESCVIFEELFLGAAHQEKNPDTIVRISVENRFGEVTVKLRYEGERFLLEKLKDEEFSLDILNGFGDKQYNEYHNGNNTIAIRVQNNKSGNLLIYAVIFAVAVLVGVVLGFFSPSEREFVITYVVDPIEKFLLNAMLLISTPLAFFCLMNSCIMLFEANRRRTDSRKIIINIITQSVLGLGLSMLFGIFLRNVIKNPYENYYSSFESIGLESLTGRNYVDFFFPSDIGEFFSLTKPFAFISLAILAAEAICNSGEHFETLQHAVDSVCTLLCKVLSIVLSILPIAYFAAVLGEIMENSLLTHLLSFGFFMLSILFISLVWFSIYLIRIKSMGGKPKEFLRKSFPAFKENLWIGSSIDAVPYNIRYFSAKFKIPVRDLKDNLPILAEVSQAGNTLCFSFIAMMMLFLCNLDYSILNIITIALLSFFLGIGSPGQSGGLLSGTIIICSFLNLPIEEMISIAILMEVLLGPVATIIDTWGDIVVVYISELNKKQQEKNNTETAQAQGASQGKEENRKTKN